MLQQYGRHQDEKLHGPGIFLAVDQPACSLFCADGLVQVQGFGLRLFGLDEFRAWGLRLGSYKLYGIRLHGVGSRIPGLHTFPYARSPTKSLSPFYIYVYTHTKGYMYIYIYIYIYPIFRIHSYMWITYVFISRRHKAEGFFPNAGGPPRPLLPLALSF